MYVFLCEMDGGRISGLFGCTSCVRVYGVVWEGGLGNPLLRLLYSRYRNHNSASIRSNGQWQWSGNRLSGE